jgi:hypothetical protein
MHLALACLHTVAALLLCCWKPCAATAAGSWLLVLVFSKWWQSLVNVDRRVKELDDVVEALDRHLHLSCLSFSFTLERPPHLRVNCITGLLRIYATFFLLNTNIMKLRKTSSLS